MSKTTKMRSKSGILLAVFMSLVLIVSMILSSFTPIHGDTIIADNSTFTKWSDTTGSNTKNIGRIWTDKTVSTKDIILPASTAEGAEEITISKGDSDFLVALSTLSSAGRIIGEVTHTVPLDIVIVMDITQGLAIQDGGNGRNGFEAQQDAVNRFIDQIAEVNLSAEDGQAMYRIAINHSASTGGQTGTNGFIECWGEGVDQLHNVVNSFAPQSSFNPEKGFTIASDYAQQSRDDSKSIVIVFGSAQHSGGNAFNKNNANKGFPPAKELKDKGSTIYTIGTFSDCNTETPTTSSNVFDQFMHTVSSNYPTATSYDDFNNPAKDDEGNLTEFYKAAEDTVGLEKILEEIFMEITELPPTSPTEDAIGDGNSSAVTFYDELGDYMKVDDFKNIVFADMVFYEDEDNHDYSDITDVDGKVIGTKTIHHFKGTASSENPIYPQEADLSEIDLIVDHYNDPAIGDKITITIPAKLIPLRFYHVDARTGKEEMRIDEAYPLRIFYGASVKDGVDALLANPDTKMQSYININKNSEGQVNFYANKYYAPYDDKGNAINNGGVYAEFTPNESNDFYYFQKDQPLFTDDKCEIPATGEIDESEDVTYYYLRTYYELVDGKPELTRHIVPIPSTSNIVLHGFVEKDDSTDNLYIPKGTPRTTSLYTYALEKEDVEAETSGGEVGNITGTASYATKPKWDNLDNPKNVIVSLGNNGVMPVELPGQLEVTKTVEAEEGLTPNPNAMFEFTLSLENEPTNAEYSAQIFTGATPQENGSIKVSDGSKFDLKHGQTIKIYGLEAGIKYTITETQDEAHGFAGDHGFALNTKESTTGEGKINAGITKEEKFVNTYTVSPLEVHSQKFGLEGTKEIQGREFENGDIFKFVIEASTDADYSPLPEDDGDKAIINPNTGTTADIQFGEFVFEEPGHYRYSIIEYKPNGTNVEKDPADKILPGVAYDTTVYRLTLDVKDNGYGELYPTNVEIHKNSGKLNDENWELIYPQPAVDQEEQEGAGLPETGSKFLQFTNVYTEKTAPIDLVGFKNMANKLLQDYTLQEQFGFVLEANAARELDENGNGTGTWTEENDLTYKIPMPKDNEDGTMPYRNLTTGNIDFPGFVFTHEDAGDGYGREYRYTIRELQPTLNGKYDGVGLDGATKENDDPNGRWVYSGVTFDKTVHEVVIKITCENDNTPGNETEIVRASITYDGNTSLSRADFTNVYNAATEIGLTGIKNIDGRAFKDDDAFTFSITPKDDAPLPYNADGKQQNRVTIEPTQGDTEATINFGTFKFNQDDMTNARKTSADGQHATYEKDFTYTIKEENGNLGGIQYDAKTYDITFRVTDDGYGNLTATRIDTLGDLVWNNNYRTSMTYSGIDVLKTLSGRNLRNDEFEFTITPKVGTDTPALEKIEDQSFKNGPSAMNVAYVMNKLSSLTFDQYDAGKTYYYIVDENNGSLGGITYDQSQYEVAITVIDDGDGNISADTKITKIMDKEGNAITLDSATTIAFNNAYNASPGTLVGETDLKVTKYFLGREDNKWLNDDKIKDVFTFTLELTGVANGGDQSAVEMQTSKIEISGDDLQNGNYQKAFGNIKFSKTGTYTFTISEDTTGLADKGITAFNPTRTITVEVSDPGNGTLMVVKQASSDTLNFLNYYNAEETDLMDIKVKKTLTGRDWIGGDEGDVFSFTLAAGDTTTEHAIEIGDVQLPDLASLDIKEDTPEYLETFGKITFTEPGNYTFKVTEVIPKNANNEIINPYEGITYDTSEKIFTVNVVDNNLGNLVAEVTSINDVHAIILDDSITFEFTNKYAASGILNGATNLQFTKTLTGRTGDDKWLSTDSFDFTLAFDHVVYEGTDVEVSQGVTTYELIGDTDQNGIDDVNISGQSSTIDKNSNFGDINFTKPGTYYFNINEVIPEGTPEGTQKIPSVTYDERKYVLTVVVTDENNNGELTVELSRVDVVAKDAAGKDVKTEVVDKKVEFINHYTPDPTNLRSFDNASIKAKKEYTVNGMTRKDNFEIWLLATTDDAPLPEGAIDQLKTYTITTEASDGNPGETTIDLGDIKFTSPGEYRYELYEKTPENPADRTPGMKYSDALYEIIIEVIDDTEYGKLEVNSVTLNKLEDDAGLDVPEEEQKIDPTNNGEYIATIINEYNIKTAVTSPLGDKILEDKTGENPLVPNMFKFKITALNSAPTPENVQSPFVVGHGKETDSKGSISFGQVTFTGDDINDQPDDKPYEYIIQEVNDGKAGITYDNRIYKFSVVVYEDNVPVNPDKPGETQAVIRTRETIKVAEYNSALGDHWENYPLDAWKDYTNNKIEFRNVYSPDPIEYQLKGIKMLTGRDFNGDDHFRFELTPANNNAKDQDKVSITKDGKTEPITSLIASMNPENGEFSFDTMTFSSVGTYEFNIKELLPEAEGVNEDNPIYKGVTYDRHTTKVTVVVSDKKDADGHSTGEFKIEETYDNGTVDPNDTKAVFKNTYRPASVTLQGSTALQFTKELVGRDWLDGETFNFTIVAVDPETDEPLDQAPMPSSANAQATAPQTGRSTNFAFGDIIYDADDLSGVAEENGIREKRFKYIVSEQIPTVIPDSMEYDDHSVSVIVKLTDNGTGQLAVSTDYSGDRTFKNSYKVSKAYDGLAISKVLNGHDMAQGQFEFIVQAMDEASANKVGYTTEPWQESVSSLAASDGVAAIMKLFENMSFNQDDAGKTFIYTIKEKTDPKVNGYTYDATERSVEISVVNDATAGELHVTTKVIKDGDVIEFVDEPAVVPFVNTYRASGYLGGEGNDVYINAHKTLTGRELVAEEFNFNVYYTDDKNFENILAYGTNDADGNITFGRIGYTTEYLKEAVKYQLATEAVDEDTGNDVYTFSYTVVEDTTGLADKGITATAHSFNITVNITDNNDGTLTPVVIYPDETNRLDFENVYNAESIPYKINGTKKLSHNGNNLSLSIADIAGKFNFTLSGVDEEGKPAPTPDDASKNPATNDASGTINFGEITYELSDLNDVETAADGSRTKTYTYTVKETGSYPGVTNANDQTFTVTLKDDGKGRLAVTSNPSGTMFTFDNTYSITSVTSSVTDQFKILKTLNGRDLTAGEFKFELKDVNDKVVASGVNDANGIVTMSKMTFTQPDTHQYTLYESKVDKVEGVTYDTNEYDVTATVSDHKDGTLKVVWSIADSKNDQVEFINTYNLDSTSVTLGATKLLNGRALKDGEFTFVLKDEAGKVLQTKANNANGGIEFDSIPYTKAGEYHYTIAEVSGNVKGITYDDTVYSVTVKVVDNGKGQLEATVEGDTRVFVNEYSEIKAPDTGDNTPFVAYAILFIASGLLYAANEMKKSLNYHKK